MTDFPRQTCANCDAMTKLVKLQTEEIKALRTTLAKTGCNDVMCTEAGRKCLLCAAYAKGVTKR